MGLLDDLEPRKGQNYPCKVRNVAESLEEADRKALLDAVDSPKWGLQVLSSELAKRGINLGRWTLENHRKKTCSCSKT
jgi:hypothetical protein